MLLALVALWALDWLWPVGFRFKRWQYTGEEKAVTMVAGELAARFPPGADVARAHDFLTEAGAHCRDKFEFFECGYRHFSPASKRSPWVVVWTVKLWHDGDSKVTRFQVFRRREEF